jgi:tetratricopeptide (TPR) repeat protein
MENELKYIDDYFQQKLSEIECQAFNSKLATDKPFAELVAFYVQTKAIERDNALANRHNEWTQLPKPENNQISFGWIATGLAAILLVTISVIFLNNKDKNYQEIADNYLKNELVALPVKMDAKADSLELGKKYYNAGDYKQAQKIFDNLTISNNEALEYEGLAALQSADYKVAIRVFTQLANDKELLNNKGNFYLAITYLKMNENEKAIALLNEIVKNNLPGSEKAKKILE